MVVGLVVWELHIPGCASLKEKRMVVKSLKDRLHAKVNVSAAETAHHDLLQRSEIAVTGFRETGSTPSPCFPRRTGWWPKRAGRASSIRTRRSTRRRGDGARNRGRRRQWPCCCLLSPVFRTLSPRLFLFSRRLCAYAQVQADRPHQRAAEAGDFAADPRPGARPAGGARHHH
ncbi:MAG: DUF503 domain-containing protein, partial [Gemmatimonadetes bacterium]|nr:DUF503 domain-containing protein [Gemmatimonadota bacterium]